jgi:hypothetical protein
MSADTVLPSLRARAAIGGMRKMDADITVSALVELDEIVDEMLSSWQTGDGAE